MNATRRIALLLWATLAIALAWGATDAGAEEPPAAQPGDRIAWVEGVKRAFEVAETQNKIVLICINSTRVDGGREEPAAKWLRETAYKNLAVVGKSRGFVCVFLNGSSAGEDWGEMKVRFGIEGAVVSPQHILAAPTHKKGPPLVREEYWSHGYDDKAIAALLGLMDEATKKWQDKGPTTPAVPGDPIPDAPLEDGPGAGGANGAGDGGGDAGAAAAQAARAAWLADLLSIVRAGPSPRRQEAIRTLIVNDQEGDCTSALGTLLADPAHDEDIPLLVDVIRGLGRPGLVAASSAVAARLGHEHEGVRGNAAVSLEYIGNPESVKPLMERLKREKDQLATSHIQRALGRCGAGDAKVRERLVKDATSFKEDLESYGPIIGLAYFKGDEKAARAVEKLLGKMGPPAFGRRGGGGEGTLRRVLLAWALAHVGDAKSATMVEERILDPLRNVQSPWIQVTLAYYQAVVAVCRGRTEEMGNVENGVTGTLSFVGGLPLQDEARRNREDAGFRPLGDWQVEARPPGGMGGGGG